VVVLTTTWSLRIPEARSLKEKRMVLRSLKDRLKKLNLSVAEVGDHDRWGSATLAAVVVATDGAFADSVMSKADDLVEREHRVLIVGTQRYRD
jgi:uncharacterized protein YlxP (DUF503 family)